MEDQRVTRALRRTEFGGLPEAPDAARPGGLVGGKYRVIDELGEGAMGVVLRGRDEQLERDVAIKLIRPERARRANFQHDFLAEARTMARISHPNVVQIFDFGWEQDTPFFAMELVEGEDLETHHANAEYRLDPERAIAMMLGICRGVEAIHNAGACHRDLKPNNVLVAGDGRVLVSDLGLTATSAEHDARTVVGTPGFVAPEVILDGPTTGPMALRADVYALGAVAYELLCGQPAFLGETAVDVLQAQLKGEFLPLAAHDAALGPPFDHIVAQALAPDPRDRLPSASELLLRLETAAAQRLDPTFGRRIVVVDDDAFVRRFIARLLALKMPNTVVECVSNGREALHGLSNGGAAVLITDVEMPGLGGVELVQLVRGLERFDETAIIVVTARAGPAAWSRLRACGADAFLMKPLDAIPLLALIESLIANPKRNRTGGMPR